MFGPPRCRGRAVFNWSIILNFQKMTAYAMELKPGVDDGDIFIKKISISQQDDINSLYLKNAIVSSEFFLRSSNIGIFLQKIKNRKIINLQLIYLKEILMIALLIGDKVQKRFIIL